MRRARFAPLALSPPLRAVTAPAFRWPLVRAASTPAATSSSAGAAVPAAAVKALRDRTGAPMMECRNALAAEGGDMERAVDWLRKRGAAAAGSKSGRAAAQGLVAAAVTDVGDSAVLVEVRAALVCTTC